MQVFFGEETELLGRSLWQKTKGATKKAGRVTGKAVKATVTAPAKVATKTVKVIATPVIGKKATGFITKGINVTANPYTQASLARTGTQKVIGKKGYRALSQSQLNPIKNPSLYASAVSNLVVPGSGLAVASGLKAGSALKSNLKTARNVTRNIKSVIPSGLAKKASSFLPSKSATDTIKDIVQKNIPQIVTPQPQAEDIQQTDDKIKSNLPLIITGGLVAVYLLAGKHK